MYVDQDQSRSADMLSAAERKYLERNSVDVSIGLKQRSYSVDNSGEGRASDLIDRMKHTFEFKVNESKGFESYKGNIRSEYIRASFLQLEDLFQKLPETMSFDIEISESPTYRKEAYH